MGWGVAVVTAVEDSPLLPAEAHIQLAALQVLTGVAHDLVEGVLQQVVPADYQPGKTQAHTRKETRHTHTHKRTKSTKHTYRHMH